MCRVLLLSTVSMSVIATQTELSTMQSIANNIITMKQCYYVFISMLFHY